MGSQFLYLDPSEICLIQAVSLEQLGNVVTLIFAFNLNCLVHRYALYMLFNILLLLVKDYLTVMESTRGAPTSDGSGITSAFCNMLQPSPFRSRLSSAISGNFSGGPASVSESPFQHTSWARENNTVVSRTAGPSGNAGQRSYRSRYAGKQRNDWSGPSGNAGLLGGPSGNAGPRGGLSGNTGRQNRCMCILSPPLSSLSNKMSSGPTVTGASM